MTTSKQIIAEAAWATYRATMLGCTDVAYPRWNLSLEECRMIDHLCARAAELLQGGAPNDASGIALALSELTSFEYNALDAATEVLYSSAADAACMAHAHGLPRLYSVNDAAHAALLAGDDEAFCVHLTTLAGVLAADGSAHEVTAPDALARRTYAAMHDVLTPDHAQMLDPEALWDKASAVRKGYFMSAARAALSECGIAGAQA